MNIREELLKEHSKSQTQKIANYIGADAERFAKLMDFLFRSEPRITQRAAWVVSTCADQHPGLMQHYLSRLIENLENPVHDAVKRNTVRILQKIEIPEELQGTLVNICFRFLEDNEPAATKAFAMTVLANLVKKEPDLKNELRIIIEDQLPYASPAFVSRGNKILDKLRSSKH